MEKRLYEKQEIYDPATIAELSEHYAAILRLLGEDPTREGLLKTPERVAKAMAFMTKGLRRGSARHSPVGYVPREGIPADGARARHRGSLLCEHHMLPLRQGAVAYIPDGYITGLSKVARVVEVSHAACKYRNG